MSTPRIIATYTRTATPCQSAMNEQIQITNRFLRTQLGVSSTVIYCDDGYTGTTMQRPALQALLRHIDAGFVEAVVVDQPIRLSATYVQQLQLQTRLEQAGVPYWVASPSRRIVLVRQRPEATS